MRRATLAATLALSTGCATWNGSVSGRWPERQTPLIPAPFADVVHVAPPVVDPASHPDVLAVADTFARSYQDALTEECNRSGLFSVCTATPVPGALKLVTYVTIAEAEVENVGAYIVCAMLLPPLLGAAYAVPLFLYPDFEGDLRFELEGPDGASLVARSWHQASSGSPGVALRAKDGFPKFLEDARHTLVARRGMPGAPPLAAAVAPAPVPPVELMPATPAGPSPAQLREEAPRAREPRPVVAIFDVQDSTRQLDAALLDQLTEYLSAQLVEVARFRVVPRNQLRSQLAAEKAGTYDACFEESCQIELGKAVAAEKSLATKLLRVGDTCAMTATLYDLRSETTEVAASVEGECSVNALMSNAKALAAKLATR